MATKTQGIFEGMNYFLTFKESGGGFCDSYSDVLKSLSDIYIRQPYPDGLCRIYRRPKANVRYAPCELLSDVFFP